jgi:ring-1,2-phenylacetyl-CoA epoxidase subunit PaaA
MFQEALDRWWVPIMHFFGPPTKPGGDLLLAYRFKTATNEQLRQRFFSLYVPKLWDMGFEIPDPALAWDDELGEWRWTEPDWEPLRRIARGQGPMTETRLAWRRWVHEAHGWVREVMAEPEPRDLEPVDAPPGDLERVA